MSSRNKEASTVFATALCTVAVQTSAREADSIRRCNLILVAFDIKLVPYMAASNSLHMCAQLLGEVRPLYVDELGTSSLLAKESREDELDSGKDDLLYNRCLTRSALAQEQHIEAATTWQWHSRSILLPDCIGEDVRREETVGSDEFCDTETATLGEINIVQADSEGCKTDNYLSKTPRAYIIGGEYQ